MNIFNINQKSADLLKITVTKEQKRIGFFCMAYQNVDLQNKITQKAAVIESFSDDCFLNQYLKSEDVLVRINDFFYHESKWIDSTKLSKEHMDENGAYGCLLDVTKLPFKDGEIVTVQYFSKKKMKSDKQQEGGPKFYYEETIIKIPFFWCYRVEGDSNFSKKLSLLKILNTEKAVKESLFDQDHAVDQVFKSIKLKAAGLKEENKPVGSYLFTGPTGVGKTELAKILAQELNYPLVRIDMSEYMHSHSVHRLVGAPPSYLGYGDETILEKEVGSKGRNVILLLDEMEKAHFDIQKIFLQAMDNSKVTLGNNKEVDFSNTIILMTSNCGVVQRNNLGLVTTEETLSVDMSKVRESFLPEFIGRLSGVVTFNPLTEKSCRKIITKMVQDFNKKYLTNKNTSLKLTEDLENHLLTTGFDRIYGARTIKNFFKDTVLNKLADKMLNDSLNDVNTDGTIIIVDYKNKEITLETELKVISIQLSKVADQDNNSSFMSEVFNGFKLKKES